MFKDIQNSQNNILHENQLNKKLENLEKQINKSLDSI
jgi:hypothetical protein